MGYTDFYFISREGNYQTADGKTGYPDLKASLPKLIFQREDVVVNSVVPNQPEVMVFAVPAGPGSYRGFAYEAIAISFNNSDLVETLEISAFSGQSSSYVIHPDGRVIVDNASMSALQTSSLLLVAGIAVGFVAVLLALIIRRYRHSLTAKDTEIRYREELFSTLSNNVDDIFAMLDADSLRLDYISPNIAACIGRRINGYYSSIKKS